MPGCFTNSTCTLYSLVHPHTLIGGHSVPVQSRPRISLRTLPTDHSPPPLPPIEVILSGPQFKAWRTGPDQSVAEHAPPLPQIWPTGAPPSPTMVVHRCAASPPRPGHEQPCRRQRRGYFPAYSQSLFIQISPCLFARSRSIIQFVTEI